MWQFGHGLGCLCIFCVHGLKVQQPPCIALRHSCLEGNHSRAKEDRKDNPGIFIHCGCGSLIAFSSLLDVHIFLSPALPTPSCFLLLHSKVLSSNLAWMVQEQSPTACFTSVTLNHCSVVPSIIWCSSIIPHPCASHLSGLHPSEERSPLHFSF